MAKFNAKYYTTLKAPAFTSNDNGYLYSNGKFRTKIKEDDLPDNYILLDCEGFPVVFAGVDKIVDCVDDGSKVYVSFDGPVVEYDIKGESRKRYGGYQLTVKGDGIEELKRFLRMMGREKRCRVAAAAVAGEVQERPAVSA